MILICVLIPLFYVRLGINLWDEHLPPRTLVVLSGCDILCPTLHVRKWLETHTQAKVLFNPEVAHGAGLLLNPGWQQTILREVTDMMARESDDIEDDCNDDQIKLD